MDNDELGSPVVQRELIINAYETTEINPQHIADALNGVLQENRTIDSQWDILLGNEPERLLILQLNPKKRNIFLLVPNGKEHYRCAIKLVSIKSIFYIKYRPTPDDTVQTDIRFLVSNNGIVDASMILSSSTFQIGV